MYHSKRINLLIHLWTFDKNESFDLQLNALSRARSEKMTKIYYTEFTCMQNTEVKIIIFKHYS